MLCSSRWSQRTFSICRLLSSPAQHSPTRRDNRLLEWNQPARASLLLLYCLTPLGSKASPILFDRPVTRINIQPRTNTKGLMPNMSSLLQANASSLSRWKVTNDSLIRGNNWDPTLIFLYELPISNSSIFSTEFPNCDCYFSSPFILALKAVLPGTS
jgi:hypothetical protein